MTQTNGEHNPTSNRSPSRRRDSVRRAGTNGAPEPARAVIAEAAPSSVQALHEMAREAGLRVAARTGSIEELERRCAAIRPDLVLVDIGLLLPDRLDVIERITSDLGLPVVVRLEAAQALQVNRATESGAAAVIGPNCEPAVVRGAVSAVVQWRRRLLALQDEINGLRRRLDNRKIIERAKWRIVETSGVSEPEALRALQRFARRSREPLVSVANRALERPESINDMLKPDGE